MSAACLGRAFHSLFGRRFELRWTLQVPERSAIKPETIDCAAFYAVAAGRRGMAVGPAVAERAVLAATSLHCQRMRHPS